MNTAAQTAGDETAIHVAQFLQEPVGATRQRQLAHGRLPLDGELTARDVAGEAKLTRIPAGILVAGEVTATVTIQCIRCLEDFAQPVRATFADEYRPIVHVPTGEDLAADGAEEGEADYFTISDTHVIDLRESLRQALVLGLPMAPHCREDCPGLAAALDGAGDAGDGRLAVLEQLLGGVGAGAGAGEGEPPRRAAR